MLDHEVRITRLEAEVGSASGDAYRVVDRPGSGSEILGGSDSAYEVLPGDTLTSLSRKFGTTVDRLAAVNDLASDGHIRIGQLLVVPSPAGGDVAGDRGSGPVVAAGGPARHEIQPGETLFSIARRHGTTVREIQALNGISDPELIWAGQVLRIGAVPLASPQRSVPAESLPASPPPNGSRIEGAGESPADLGHATHTVRRGETLATIARTYGTTAAAIQGVNGLHDPNLIRPGQRLRLPSTTGAAPPPTEAESSPGRPAETGADASTDYIAYYVIDGDTVESIARLFDTSPARLRTINELPPNGQFRARQRILVPADTVFTTP